MTQATDSNLANNSSDRKPRLWPAIALVAAYWLVVGFMKLVTIKTLFPEDVFTQLVHFLVAFYSPMLLAVGILIWWLGFSRLPWSERLIGLGLLIGGGILARLVADKSMAFGLLMNGIPAAITAAVAAMLVVNMAIARASSKARLATLAIASVLAWGYFTLIRLDGITGQLKGQQSWRWTETAEDRFLKQRTQQSGKVARADDSQLTAHNSPLTPLVATPADWPQFRGPRRDGNVHDVSLTGDWSANPPPKLWRRRVGPGWSSFAVVGNRGFTQEQRGDKEAVFCFDVATGNELWSHEDKSRFEETVSGAGPRATPTFDSGRIYSLGGSGVLNCLDAASGNLVWSRDITADAKAKPTDENLKPPGWGFSSSPVICRGMAIVFAGGGKDKKGLLAYDAVTGELRWAAGQGVHSYSSPQILSVGDQQQVLMVSDRGLEAFDPADGQLLWEHDWYLKDMFRVLQPHVAGDGQILLATPLNYGTRLLEIKRQGTLARSASEASATPLPLGEGAERSSAVEGVSTLVRSASAGNADTLARSASEGNPPSTSAAIRSDDSSPPPAWTVTEKWTSKDLKPYFNDGVQIGDHLYGFDNDILVCIDLATGKKKWKKGRYGNGQALLVGGSGQLLIISEQGDAVLAEISPQGLTERGKFKALSGKTWNHPVIAAGKLLVRNSEEMACYELMPPTSSL
jgi:outer membrane protein assembly factor BamB